MILKFGSTGKNVGILQHALNLAEDNDFGPVTEAAVKAFQQERGLVVDGRVGPITAAALNVTFGPDVPTPVPASTVRGIDVSRYEPEVNYTQVAAGGYKFVIAKATEGLHTVDSTFATHRRNAAAAGLIVGAYHFFHPVMDGVAQADHLLQTVGNLLPGELPLALDIEFADGLQELGRYSDNALACLKKMESATGLVPIIYTSFPFFQGFSHTERFLKYSPWIAAYNNVGPRCPAPWTAAKWWQFTDHEAVPGAGKIDASIFYGSLADLQAMTKK